MELRWLCWAMSIYMNAQWLHSHESTRHGNAVSLGLHDATARLFAIHLFHRVVMYRILEDCVIAWNNYNMSTSLSITCIVRDSTHHTVQSYITSVLLCIQHHRGLIPHPCRRSACMLGVPRLGPTMHWNSVTDTRHVPHAGGHETVTCARQRAVVSSSEPCISVYSKLTISIEYQLDYYIPGIANWFFAALTRAATVYFTYCIFSIHVLPIQHWSSSKSISTILYA